MIPNKSEFCIFLFFYLFIILLYFIFNQNQKFLYLPNAANAAVLMVLPPNGYHFRSTQVALIDVLTADILLMSAVLHIASLQKRKRQEVKKEKQRQGNHCKILFLKVYSAWPSHALNRKLAVLQQQTFKVH